VSAEASAADAATVARREAALRELCAAHADGRLSAGDFEARYAALQGAATSGAVLAVLQGLDGTPAAGLAPATPPPAVTAAAAAAEEPPGAWDGPPLRLAAVFSELKRDGRWTVPPEVEVRAWAGEVKLDLREALVYDPTLSLHLDVVLGSVVLVVPPGADIGYDVDQVLTSFEHKRKRREAQTGDGLAVLLTGRCWLASVEVVEKPLPGDALPSWWSRVGRQLFGEPGGRLPGQSSGS